MTARKTLRATGLAAVTLLLCTGCFSADRTGDATGQEPTQEPSPTSTYVPTRSANNAPQAPEAETLTNPQWLPADAEAAKEVAVKAMRAFARPDMENPQWANDFARWLTPKATTDYSAVDPANVPVTEVTGDAELEIEEANGFGAMAFVPTDIGIYRVQLLRDGQNEPWKVNRLYPPESGN